MDAHVPLSIGGGGLTELPARTSRFRGDAGDFETKEDAGNTGPHPIAARPSGQTVSTTLPQPETPAPHETTASIDTDTHVVRVDRARLISRLRRAQSNLRVNRMRLFAESEVEKQFRRDAFMSYMPQQFAFACCAVIYATIYLGLGIGLQDAGAVIAYDAVVIWIAITTACFLLWRWYNFAFWRQTEHASSEASHPSSGSERDVAVDVAPSASTARPRFASPFGRYESLSTTLLDAAWFLLALMLALRPGVYLLHRCPELWVSHPVSVPSVCQAYGRGNTVYELVAFPVLILIFYAGAIGLILPLTWILAFLIFSYSVATQITWILENDSNEQAPSVFQLITVWFTALLATVVISHRRCYDSRAHFAAVVALETQNVVDKDLQAELSREREARGRIEAAQATHSVVGNYVAHQLRNPLHQMELLLDDTQQGNAGGARSEVQHMREALANMKQVIEDMQLNEELTRGNIIVDSTQLVDVRDLVNSALAGMAGGLQRFDKRIAPGVPDCIRSDPLRLKQLLSSMLATPIQMSGVTNATVFLDVRTTTPCTLQLLVEFAYQPGGVNPSEILLADTAAIVDTRLMHSWQQQQSALGLAVVLSQGLARVLGGRCEVAVSTAAGQPSSITATIPYTAVSPKPPRIHTADSMAQPLLQANMNERAPGTTDAAPFAPENRASQVAVQEDSNSGKIILVVDDSDMNRALHARLVKRLGCTAEVCTDGDEVLSFLQEASNDNRNVALIMMDIVMPRMNGVDCCRLLRSRGYTMPILAVTANASLTDRTKFLEQGFDDLLPKPFSIAALQCILSRFIT